MDTEKTASQTAAEACEHAKKYPCGIASKPPALDVRTALHYADQHPGAYPRRRHCPQSRSIMESAHLSKANLRNAELIGSFLKYATLDQADLTNADLRGASLESATLKGAKLRGVLNLTQAQLDLACGDEKTDLAPGLTLKTCQE
jgi:Pentapeptide repeats (8 copies)